MQELHSVVVPMYNEAAVVERFYARATEALASLDGYELVIVDDGSSDRRQASHSSDSETNKAWQD